MSFNVLKIKGLMSEKKITQDELSKLMGATRQTISNYLSERSKLDVYTLEKIAVILGVNVSYFFDENKIVEEPINPYNKPKFLEERVADLEKRLKELEKEIKK